MYFCLAKHKIMAAKENRVFFQGMWQIPHFLGMYSEKVAIFLECIPEKLYFCAKLLK